MDPEKLMAQKIKLESELAQLEKDSIDLEARIGSKASEADQIGKQLEVLTPKIEELTRSQKNKQKAALVLGGIVVAGVVTAGIVTASDSSPSPSGSSMDDIMGK